jgi:hypothetical protein
MDRMASRWALGLDWQMRIGCEIGRRRPPLFVDGDEAKDVTAASNDAPNIPLHSDIHLDVTLVNFNCPMLGSFREFAVSDRLLGY